MLKWKMKYSLSLLLLSIWKNESDKINSASLSFSSDKCFSPVMSPGNIRRKFREVYKYTVYNHCQSGKVLCDFEKARHVESTFTLVSVSLVLLIWEIRSNYLICRGGKYRSYRMRESSNLHKSIIFVYNVEDIILFTHECTC